MKNKRRSKHGLSWDENGKMLNLYGRWLKMKSRCYNPNHKSYHIYGGRGITVCDAWRDDYLVFHKWAMANGYKPGLSIERKDNMAGYSPQNCTWVSRTAQANNRRSNHIINYKGNDYTLAQINKKYGLKHGTVIGRLSRGWSIEDAIERPLDNRGGHNCLSSNR